MKRSQINENKSQLESTVHNMRLLSLCISFLLLSEISAIGQGYLGFHPIRAGIYTLDGRLYKGQLIGFENDQLYLYLSLAPFPADSFTAPIVFFHIDDIDRMKVEGYQAPAFFPTMLIGGAIGYLAGITNRFEHGGVDGRTIFTHAAGTMAGLAGGPLLIREKINQEFRFDPYTDIRPFKKSWKRYIKNAQVDFDMEMIRALPYHEVDPNAEAPISLNFEPDLIDLPARKQALHIPRLHLRWVGFPHIYKKVLQKSGFSAEVHVLKYLRISVQQWKGEYYQWKSSSIPTFPPGDIGEVYSGNFRDLQLGLTITPWPVNRLFTHRLIPRLGAGIMARKYDGFSCREISYYTLGDTDYQCQRYLPWSPGFYAQFGFDFLFSRHWGLSADFVYKSDRGILESDSSVRPFTIDTPYSVQRKLTSFLPFAGICLRLF